MTLRACRRAVVLASALMIAVLRYGWMRLGGPLTPDQRALWMHLAGRDVMAALGIRCHLHGQPPAYGLVVSNHLSYLDIVILSAVMPALFISKIEIGSWPFFGTLARMGGTMFINRSSRASAAAVASDMAERLRSHLRVLLFAEGTSSDGSQVLRFHSSLFEPAVAQQIPVTAAAVRYVIEDGGQERDLCWFDDTLFLPHIWKALGTRGFFAEVEFGEPHVYPDRRTAAAATHGEVDALRRGVKAGSGPNAEPGQPGRDAAPASVLTPSA